MGLMHGDRVQHFWDGEQRVGTALMRFWEGLSFPAWDVWLLYAPGITWDEEGAPEPSWWENQLSVLDRSYPDRRLDAARFARKAKELGDTAAARLDP